MSSSLILRSKLPNKQNIILNYNIDNLLSPEIKEKTSKFIVKSLSDTLPQFDSISHIVLNTNSKIITDVLQNDFIDPQIKKYIILFTIKMTQEGDNMGSRILELYYNIVDKIL
jgi:hypothetical protein